MFNVKWNTKNTINYLGTIDTNLRKAQISATNKMAAQAFTQAKKAIRDRYTIKLSDINAGDSRHNSIFLNKTFNTDLPAKIVATGKGLSLTKFKYKKTDTGVSVEVVKGRPKVIRHSFVATMKNQRTGEGQHTGIFVRFRGNVMPILTKKGKRYLRTAGSDLVPRFPIDEKFSVGFAVMLRSKSVQRSVVNFINSKFKSIMDHEIKFFLKIK